MNSVFAHGSWKNRIESDGSESDESYFGEATKPVRKSRGCVSPADEGSRIEDCIRNEGNREEDGDGDGGGDGGVGVDAGTGASVTVPGAEAAHV